MNASLGTGANLSLATWRCVRWLLKIIERSRQYLMSGHLVLIAILGLAAALRLFMLSSQSLWIDEGASLAMTNSGNIPDTLDALRSISGGDKHQPIYFLLLAQWRSLVGDSQFLLELLSVIPGVLTVLLIYRTVHGLFDKQHAYLSATFITCSAFCISFSQEVRPYAYLLFVGSLQTYMMSPALLSMAKQGWTDRWAFACVTCLATLSSIFLALFAVALAASHLASHRNVKSWARWWLPSTLSSIPAAFFYAGNISTYNMTADAINRSDSPIWQNMLYSMYSHLSGQTTGPSVHSIKTTDNIKDLLLQHTLSLGILALATLVLAWYVLHMARHSAAQPTNRLPCLQFFIWLFTFSFIAAVGFAGVTSINWMPRHSFYLMIPLGVIVSLAVMHGFQHQRRQTVAAFLPVCVSRFLVKPLQRPMLLRARLPISFLAFLTLLAINLYSSYQYYFKPEHRLDDYRSAAAYLSANVQKQDASLMLWGEPYLLSYYDHAEVRSLWRLEDPAVIMREINKAYMESDSVFISINRESSWEKYSIQLRSALNASYELLPQVHFINFSIYKLQRRERELATLS